MVPGDCEVRPWWFGGESIVLIRLGRIFINVLSTRRLMAVPVFLWKSEGRRVFEKS